MKPFKVYQIDYSDVVWFYPIDHPHITVPPECSNYAWKHKNHITFSFSNQAFDGTDTWQYPHSVYKQSVNEYVQYFESLGYTFSVVEKTHKRFQYTYTLIKLDLKCVEILRKDSKIDKISSKRFKERKEHLNNIFSQLYLIGNKVTK